MCHLRFHWKHFPFRLFLQSPRNYVCLILHITSKIVQLLLSSRLVCGPEENILVKLCKFTAPRPDQSLLVKLHPSPRSSPTHYVCMEWVSSFSKFTHLSVLLESSPQFCIPHQGLLQHTMCVWSGYPRSAKFPAHRKAWSESSRQIFASLTKVFSNTVSVYGVWVSSFNKNFPHFSGRVSSSFHKSFPHNTQNTVEEVMTMMMYVVLCCVVLWW